MIRQPAARKLAELVLTQPIVRLKVTPEILDMTAKVIMTFVAADEQRQRSEKILGEGGKK